MDAPDVGEDRSTDYGRVVAGVVVLVVGIAMLVNRLSDADVRVSSQVWPVILIVIGLARMTGGASRHRPLRGMWLVFIGCWGLVNEYHLWGFDYDTSWPLLLVGAGLGMVWRALNPPMKRLSSGRQE